MSEHWLAPQQPSKSPYEVNVPGKGWLSLDTARSWQLNHEVPDQTWRVQVRRADTGEMLIDQMVKVGK